MPYPVTVPPSPQGYNFAPATYPTAYPGFEYNGNLYLFLVQGGFDVGGDSLLHAMKSTDSGLTWIEQDSGNAPSVDQFTVARDGVTVIILSTTTQDLSNGTLNTKVIDYDLISDTWFGPFTSLLQVSPVFLNNDPIPPAGFFDLTAVYMRIIVRAAGDYLIYYSGPPATVAGKWWGRMYYATFNGTTFGAPVMLPGQVALGAYGYVGAGAVVDAAGVTHLMYLSGDFTQPSTLFHVGLSSLLVFGTTQPLPDALLYFSNTTISAAACSVSPPIIYTPSGGVETISLVTEIYNPIDFSNQWEVIYSATTALNPTWSHSTIYTGLDDSGNTGDFVVSSIVTFPVPQYFTLIGGSVVLTEANGTLVVSWVTNVNVHNVGAFGSIYYTSSPSDALSWPAPTKLFDSGPIASSHEVGAMQLWSFPMSNGVGTLGIAGDLDSGSPVFSGLIAQFSVFAIAPSVLPPTCSLSAFPTTITIGDTSLLSWTTTHDPVSGVIDNGVGAAIMPSGAAVVAPTVTTTYHLLVTNTAGSSTCQATVTVTGPTTPTIPPNTPCARKIDCVIQLYKHPLDALDMTLNWDGWLEDGDAVATSNWASDVGLTLGATTVTGNATAVRVSGGTDTFAYLLRNMVTTDFGLTELRSAAVNVIACHTDPPDPYMRSTEEDIFQLIKNPLANVDLAMDWAGWLDGDQIANFSFVPAAGISVTAIKFSRTATLARVTGGTAGVDYLVEHVILTQQGRTGVRHIAIQVRSCS